MRLVLIKNNIVDNVVALDDDAEVVSQQELEARIAQGQNVNKCWVLPDDVTVGPDGGDIGDELDGETYIKPTPEQNPPPPIKSVSMFQARAALIAAGLFDAVDAAMQQAGGVELQAWEYATVVLKDSTLVQAMAAQLELTEQQIDNLFTAASQIVI